MQIGFLRKSASSPPFHSGGYVGNSINAAAPYWTIAADCLKTAPTKHLAWASNMLNAREAIVIWRIQGISVWCAHEAQRRIGGELFEEKSKVVSLKRNVGIYVSNDLEVQIAEALQSGIESSNLSGEVSLPAFRLPDELDPQVLRCKALNDLVSTVCGTVAHNHPFHG